MNLSVHVDRGADLFCRGLSSGVEGLCVVPLLPLRHARAVAPGPAAPPAEVALVRGPVRLFPALGGAPAVLVGSLLHARLLGRGRGTVVRDGADCVEQEVKTTSIFCV